MKNATDSEKSAILADIDRRLSEWTRDSSAVLRKYDRDKYIFIIENAELDKLAARKFAVLQEVRDIRNHEGVVATLSIGIGRDGETLAESYQYAGLAIDMALSRGGDQAVIKNRYTFEFYGGLSEEVEKRTKVKSRVVANALSQLIRDSSQVLVMGHKNSDMDAIGAAAGMVCAARVKGKPGAYRCGPAAHHGVGSDRTTRDPARVQGCVHQRRGRDDHVRFQHAAYRGGREPSRLCGERGTARVDQQESRSLTITAVRRIISRTQSYRCTSRMRRPHPSWSASCCSILCRPAASSPARRRPCSRAFIWIPRVIRRAPACARLRRQRICAAQVRRSSDVKRLFQSSFDQYMERQKMISSARDCGQGVIFAITGEEVDRIAAAQAADELLSIIGTQASVVAFRSGNDMAVSARAAGHVNVQLLMERLGGGGNHSAAGAQLKNTTPEEADKLITDAIRGYFDDQRTEQQDDNK